MRELTKSMLSFSWAMSLFGLKQMADLFVPGSNTTGSFEAVTRCTEDQLGSTTRSAFRAGDNLQRGLVDLTFTLLTFGLWSPGSGRGGWGQGGGQSWGQGGSGGMGTGCGTCSSTGSSASSAGAGAARAAGDVTAQAMGAGIDLMQQGVNMAYQMMGGGSNPSRDTGWGPVPPPGGGYQSSGGTGGAR